MIQVAKSDIAGCLFHYLLPNLLWDANIWPGSRCHFPPCIFSCPGSSWSITLEMEIWKQNPLTYWTWRPLQRQRAESDLGMCPLLGVHVRRRIDPEPEVDGSFRDTTRTNQALILFGSLLDCVVKYLGKRQGSARSTCP